MTLSNLEDFLDKIESGASFFCSRGEAGTEINAMILAESAQPFPSHIKETYFCLCPFDSTNTVAYRCKEQYSFTSQDFFNSKRFPEIQLEPIDTASQTQKGDYLDQVNSAKETFRSTALDKAVIAQKQTIETKSNNVLRQFVRVCQSNQSYTYILHIAGKETWVGASPELFLRTDMAQLETVALAGTRLTGSSQVWGDKELKEQSIVSDFLYKNLEKFGFQDVKKGERFTKKAGSIEHICTPVSAQVTSNVKWDQVISGLHPTPALAGFPKQDALDFIQRTERFNRGLFGGILGYISPNSIELYVNIRCAQIGKGSTNLFAGAGLNDQSDPESEWIETNNKLDVMKRLLS